MTRCSAWSKQHALITCTAACRLLPIYIVCNCYEGKDTFILIFILCIQEPEAGSAAALRHLICGGEALPPALASRVARVLPNAYLHNLYGPTEATVACVGESCPEHISSSLLPCI